MHISFSIYWLFLYVTNTNGGIIDKRLPAVCLNNDMGIDWVLDSGNNGSDSLHKLINTVNTLILTSPHLLLLYILYLF